MVKIQEKDHKVKICEEKKMIPVTFEDYLNIKFGKVKVMKWKWTNGQLERMKKEEKK
jgi:hypothetical protein